MVRVVSLDVAVRRGRYKVIKTFSITDIGKVRKLNQDYVFTSDTAVGALSNLFLLADGMGGHNAGDYASRNTVETVLETVRNSTEDNPIRALRMAIEAANRNVYQEALQKEELKGMGTTLVAATILNSYLYVANVGDSRLYIINDSIRQITKDHSLVEEMVRIGELDELHARNHPDKNIITRAIGVAEKVEADFFDIKMFPGDKILMCSDGLSNMLEDEEMLHIIRKQRDVVEMAEALVAAANQNGGKDNISVIIIEPFSDK